MKSLENLPDGYKEIFEIDLQKNKKLSFWVNAASLLIAVLMMFIATFYIPLIICVIDIKIYFLKLGALIFGLVAYIVLHELVHGVFMKYFSGIKPHYGFTSLYAYAGSSAYFCKKHYMIISLAPVVILGTILAIINFIAPFSWFWIVYMIQVINVSGAVGDLYVTYKLFSMPADILVFDTGVSMTIYSQQDNV